MARIVKALSATEVEKEKPGVAQNAEPARSTLLIIFWDMVKSLAFIMVIRILKSSRKAGGPLPKVLDRGSASVAVKTGAFFCFQK
jgi:molybdenum cofactor biosynthesis enzyme